MTVRERQTIRAQYVRALVGTRRHVEKGQLPPSAITRLFHEAWRRGFDLERTP